MSRVLPTLLAALVLGLAPSAVEATDESSRPISVPQGARLAGLFADDEPFEPEERARAVVALGTAASAPIAHALATGLVPRPDAGALAVEGAVREALLRAAELLGSAPVVRELQRLIEMREPGLDPARMLELLQRVGRAWDVELVLRIHGMDRERSPRHDAVHGATREALLGIQSRWPDLLERLARSYVSGSTDARFLIAQVAGRSTDPARAGWLVDRLGTDAEADLALLAELARDTGPLTVTLHAGRQERLRRYLWREDYQLLREAIRANGRMESMVALPDLVELLEQGPEKHREGVHAALVQITGLHLPADATRWRSWLSLESAWYDSQAERLLRRLRERNDRVVLQTLETLARHRYERHQIAAEVAWLLDDDRPSVRRSACRTLEALGVSTVLDRLVLLLDDEQAQVAAAAHAALQRLTGRELPSDPTRCRLLLDLSVATPGGLPAHGALALARNP